MVASQTAPRARAVAAAVLLLSFLVPTLPLAEAQTGGDLVAVQGEVKLSKSAGGSKSPFFAHGETVYFAAATYNTGPAVNNVRIYVFVEDRPQITGRCSTENYAAATPENGNRAYRNVSGSLSLDGGMPAGGYNVTVLVNQLPPAGYVFAGSCGQNMPVTPLDGEGNNRAVGYFVKDSRVNVAIASIRWCDGEPTSLACLPVASPITASSEYDTYLQVDVISNGTWRNLTDYGASCGANCDIFPYKVNVSVAGPGINGPLYLSPSDHATNGTSQPDYHLWNSTRFSLLDRAGNYTVTARIDWAHDLDAADNVATTTISVRYADLLPAIETDWPVTVEDAHPYAHLSRIQGNVTFRNDGPRDLSGEVVGWRVYVDHSDRIEGRFLTSGTLTNVTPGFAWTVPISWELHTTTEDDYFLTAGPHTLYAQIDYGNDFTELNDTNNTASAILYLEDITPPTFINAIALSTHSVPGGGPLPGNQAFEFHPFGVISNVTDEHMDSLVVVANFTSVEQPNVTRIYPMEFWSEETPAYRRFYSANIEELPVLGNGSASNWSVRVEARDAFNNTNVSQSMQVRIDMWNLHFVHDEYLFRLPVLNQTYNWSAPASSPDEVIHLHVYARENNTGFQDQRQNASNIEVDVLPPNGNKVTLVGAEGDFSDTPCTVTQGDDDNEEPINIPGKEGTVTHYNCADAGTFRSIILKGDGAPGVWYAWANFTDFAGRIRTVNRTFIVLDQPPTFVTLPNLSADTITAGGNVTLQARMHDDHEVVALFANFTRSDGTYANFSMGTPGSPNDGTLDVTYRKNVTTGRDRMLGNAGNYTVTFWAQDFGGTWNKSPAFEFNVSDPNRPRVLEAGVTSAIEEISTNVTFYASVHDESNVTVRVEVTPVGSSEVVFAANMTEDEDGNFTAVASFPVQNDYEWKIRAFDSLNQFSDPLLTGPLSIRLNLGPRIDLRAPTAETAGQRYATSPPRVELVIYDNDGIDPALIEFHVDGERKTQGVDYDLLPAPSGIEGYLLVFQVPQTGRADYLHGATVVINASAIDNSSTRERNWQNFTFVIDDVSPVARMEAFEPRYRADELHPWNVSMDTRFTITAHDDDGIDGTGVAHIKFRVYSLGQSSPEITYSGPFRLSEVEGISARPGTYQIQFFAEDDVGNINRDLQTQTVYLDATPPSLNNYGATPNGRDISLSIYDDRAGMDRAVLWHRTNNASYVFTTMTRDGDVWRAQLPEGRKDDRIAYYVQAWDRVNNTDTFGTPNAPLGTFEVPNHVPELRITAPLPDEIAQRTQQVTWEANDTDGDALTFTIWIRKPGQVAFSDLQRIENPGQRRTTFDTLEFGDGAYTLRVDATDGTAVVRREVNFTIRNTATAIGDVNIGDSKILPGAATLVRAHIARADATSAEARVYEGTRFVRAFALHDDGENGDARAGDREWSALVSIDKAGTYRIDVVTFYTEDGVERNATKTNAASFSVALTPGYVVGQYAPLVALVALAGAVAIGVAGYVAFRRRG